MTKDHFYHTCILFVSRKYSHHFSRLIDFPVQGVISRLHCPLVNGHRVSLKLTDGATVTYDLYHAIEAHPGNGDFTLCVCPGIGNNSESVYIRSGRGRIWITLVSLLKRLSDGVSYLLRLQHRH